MDADSIRERIFNERRRLGMTQEEVAARLGISANSFREMENGGTTLINKRLPDIAKIFGITLEELLIGYPIPANDYKKQMEESEKLYKAKMREIESRYQMILIEKEGEIKVLRATLENKNSIIGFLREKNPDY